MSQLALYVALHQALPPLLLRVLVGVAAAIRRSLVIAADPVLCPEEVAWLTASGLPLRPVSLLGRLGLLRQLSLGSVAFAGC